MESYAFLVAQRDYLKKFQLSSYPVEIEDNSKEKETTLCISVIFNNEKFTLYRPFSTIPNFWANAEKIESARQVILFNNKNQISFLDAVGKMMLEEFCFFKKVCSNLLGWHKQVFSTPKTRQTFHNSRLREPNSCKSFAVGVQY